MSFEPDENRRGNRRSAIGERYTSIEINGKSVRAQIMDLSESGMRIALPADVIVTPDDEIKVAIEKVIPNLQGRVRWVSTDPDAPDAKFLGVQFESLMINPIEEHEVQDIIDAWAEVSQTFNDLESFMRIAELIDGDIIDSKIEDIGEAVMSVTVWIERNIVPLNLWTVVEEPGGGKSCTLTVERRKAGDDAAADRAQLVQKAADNRMTEWGDGRACFFGEMLVLECFGDLTHNADLMQHVAVQLGKKIPMWTKLLIKNMAMQLLADEVDQLRNELNLLTQK